MKNLFKTLPVILLAGAVSVSCGKKENNSGGGSSNVAPPVTVTPNPGAGVTDVSAGQINIKYYTHDQLKNEFNSVAIGAHTSVNQQIVHSGSHYIGGGFQASFDMSFCFFGLGDCGSNNQYDSYMQQQIDRNQIAKIEQIQSDKIRIGYATDADNGQFIYGEYDYFSKSSSIYSDMLGLNANGEEIVVSDAYVIDQNNKKIAAKHVEFIGYNYRSYVVSSALPLAANPVMINGSYGTEGFLKQVGGTKIKQIQAVRHSMQQVQDPNNPYGYTTKKVQVSVFTIVNQ